jgi:hypothetical protein
MRKDEMWCDEMRCDEMRWGRYEMGWNESKSKETKEILRYRVTITIHLFKITTDFI